MKICLFGFVAFGIFVSVAAKMIFVDLVSKENPDYVKFVHTLTERDGHQYVDYDFWVLKDAPEPPMYIMAMARKLNGDTDYVDGFRRGPFDPCLEEMPGSAYRDHMAKHGNMSVHHVCPWEKGYFYLRDMKVDFSEDMPMKLAPGNYRMEMQTFVKENGLDVQVLDQQFFMTVE